MPSREGVSYIKRDERMGPWRPIPAPRRAIWRYRLASAVAVFRDSLEVAGVYPWRRYFWAPLLQTPEEIAEWERYEVRHAAFKRRVAALGPNPKMNDYLKAAYADDAIDALAYTDSPLMRMVPRAVGRPLAQPIVLGSK